jgi:serine/threonine protein kinase
MDISPQVPDDGRLDLFKREIDILTNLHHPNIVRLHEKIETSNHLYLVLDYCS